MGHRYLVILLVLALCEVVAGNNGSVFVTAEDRQVAVWASDAVTSWCEGGLKGEVKANRDDMANMVGGENIILDTFNKLNGTYDEIFDILLEELQVGWVYAKMTPLGLAIITLLIWPCCLCFSFCKACRCGAKERNPGLPVKICLSVVILCVFLIVILTTVWTHNGYMAMKDGSENMVCETSKLLNVTLNGMKSDNDEFIGLMGAFDELYWIYEQMQEGSVLLTEFFAILNATAPLEDSLVIAVDTVRVLTAMLGNPANVRPSSNDTRSLMHECLSCEALAATLDPFADLLNKSIGQVLFTARNEVKYQLSAEKRQDLMDVYTQATEPLLQWKNQMIGLLKWAVEPGKFDKSELESYEDYVYYSAFVVQFLAILLLVSGILATLVFIVRPTKGENHSYMHHRFACCTWCCAFPFLFLTFFFSGVLNLILIPVAGTCIVLADLDGDMLSEVASGIPDLKLEGDNGDMLKDIVDVCWAGDASRSSNLLDILFVRKNGTKVTMRSQMVKEAQEPVDKAFAEIDERVNSNNMSLVNTPEFQTLLTMLSTINLAAQMIPNKNEMDADSTYAGLMADNGRLAIAYATSCACDNTTIEGNEIPGISHFVSELKAIPGAVALGVVTSGCIEKVLCTLVLDVQQKMACDSGNAFLDLKSKIIEGDPANSKIFRCDLFSNMNPPTSCDPMLMTQDANGKWSNDCLLQSSEDYVYTKQQERSCDLAEFVIYVQDFSTRMNLTMNRLENSTLMVFSAISTQLRTLIDTYVFGWIRNLAKGITCGFMPKFVDGAINSLCYQGVYGAKFLTNSYTIVAIGIVLLSLDMYFLFRLGIDNVVKEHQREKAEQGS